ncbi:hypothetical protein GCM10022237_32880 [Nocardioides ginsengisoli]|uniref:Sigma factor-like helix-turn-helix DNA-binding protein n=1 Tax=Nocardioides ginsengisoli TaxID=363868 RepID=A0ABW3W422_9ACTN
MDFSAYVAARRPRLVRTAVLLGVPAADAEDVVQSALLRCYYFADLSERDTAAVLGIAPGTVKSRTSRALSALAPLVEAPDVR